MKRLVRYGQCYRCIYTWRMRRRRPSMCPRCKSRLWDVPKLRPVALGDGAGIDEVLGPHREAIHRLAVRFGARNLRVFGSVRRRSATPSSDVDLLVEWRREASLFDVAHFKEELRALLDRRVDVVEASELHWGFRPQVLAEAVPL